MAEVKQSLQETASKERESYKSVHKWRDTETYHADCRRDYKQTGKHRKFH